MSEPELFVFVEPQPSYKDYEATRNDPTMVDCADAGGWLRRIPDGAVTELCEGCGQASQALVHKGYNEWLRRERPAESGTIGGVVASHRFVAGTEYRVDLAAALGEGT
jgi:hypothetical protein